ncbi:MAG: 2-phosphosulfolactate phosphatase [Pseudomonadota bacterium]
MQVIRKRLAGGAKEAEGLVVIIDVFRAFSCQPLFFYFGAEKVLMEPDPLKALTLKRGNPEFILAGEVNEVPIEGGDLGNSPSEIVLKGRDYFDGKTVVHRSTAGVTGVAAALDRASEILLGSFVIAGATADYIKRKRPDRVTLVAMGDRAEREAPEDEGCAAYLEHLLTGSPYDHLQVLKETLYQSTAQKFIQGKKAYLPREDPVFCLQRDLFDFHLRVLKRDDSLEVIRGY